MKSLFVAYGLGRVQHSTLFIRLTGSLPYGDSIKKEVIMWFFKTLRSYLLHLGHQNYVIKREVHHARFRVLGLWYI